MARSNWLELPEMEWPLTRFPSVRPLIGALAWAGRPYIPVTDVFARNGDLVVQIELPGINPAKDVTLTFEDGELVVKGERKQHEEIKEDGYYRVETVSGFFERRIAVPKNVKAGDIKAEYKDGMLEILLPKAGKAPEMAKPLEIPIATPKAAKS